MGIVCRFYSRFPKSGQLLVRQLREKNRQWHSLEIWTALRGKLALATYLQSATLLLLLK